MTKKDRRLSQAQLREIAQTTGGGVDERRKSPDPLLPTEYSAWVISELGGSGVDVARFLEGITGDGVMSKGALQLAYDEHCHYVAAASEAWRADSERDPPSNSSVPLMRWLLAVERFRAFREKHGIPALDLTQYPADLPEDPRL